jgi:MSHA biogenesis protein MshI
MPLLSFLKRAPRVEGLVSVGFQSDAVSLAHIQRDKGLPPRLLGFSQKSCQGPAQQRAALAELVAGLGVHGAACVSVMEPGSYQLLQVEAPDVEPAELKAAVRWRIKDLIDFHIDDAVIDVFEMPHHSHHTQGRLMYVVATRASVIQQRAEMLAAAGLTLQAIDITELALRNLTALFPEDVDGVLFLYLTANEGIITLTRQSTLYLARNIELSGRQFLPADSADDNAQATLQRSLDNLILEAQRSLDYYESYFAQPPVKAMVIATTLPASVDISPYAQSGLGVKAHQLDLSTLFDLGAVNAAALDGANLLTLGAGLRSEEKSL